MERIVLLEFSLALVLVMRYVRRRKKLEKMRTRRKYRVRPTLQERTNHGQYHTLFAEFRLHDREYFFKYHEFSLYDLITESPAAKKNSTGNIFETSCMQIQSKYLRRWRSHKIFSSPTITDNRRLACEVKFSSTSQASRRSMSGTDYVSAINVYICRNGVPGRVGGIW